MPGPALPFASFLFVLLALLPYILPPTLSFLSFDLPSSLSSSLPSSSLRTVLTGTQPQGSARWLLCAAQAAGPRTQMSMGTRHRRHSPPAHLWGSLGLVAQDIPRSQPWLAISRLPWNLASLRVSHVCVDVGVRGSCPRPECSQVT